MILNQKQHHTKEELRRARRNLLIIILAVTAACFLLPSCTTTKYVEVPIVKTDTTYVMKLKRDSVWLHDSTFIEKAGDTIRIERWHTRYRDVLQIDTIYQATHDTIAKPYPVEVEVARPLRWWESAFIVLGEGTLLVILCLVVVWYFRKRLPL